jgi:hypothetical protein
LKLQTSFFGRARVQLTDQFQPGNRAEFASWRMDGFIMIHRSGASTIPPGMDSLNEICKNSLDLHGILYAVHHEIFEKDSDFQMEHEVKDP